MSLLAVGTSGVRVKPFSDAVIARKCIPALVAFNRLSILSQYVETYPTSEVIS